MEIIDVNDDYVEWLKKTFPSVLDSKRFDRAHKRKYVGIVFQICDYSYFAPFSSPKAKDFNKDGTIKKDSIFVLHMVKDSLNGRKQLLGTIKLLNMIPIPTQYIESYSIENECDNQYKQLVIDETKWVQKNQTKILNKARALYFFKKNEFKNKNKENEKVYDAILPFELIEYHLKVELKIKPSLIK